MGDAQVINQEPDLSNLQPIDGEAPGNEPGTITPFQTPAQDLARQKFIRLSPQPKEAAAAGQAADHLATIIHPAITAAHPEIVSQELYGQPMKATGLWAKIDSLLGKASDWVGGAVGKVAGTIGSINATNTINALSQRQMAGGGPGRNPALDKQIEDLKAKAPPAEHLGNVPAFILQMLYQMGYQGITAGEAVANYVAAAVTLEPLRKMFNILPGTQFGQSGTWAAEQFSGTFTGAVYRGLIDSGHTNANATTFALGGALLQAALFGLRIPGLSKAIEGGAGLAGKAFNTTLVDSAEAAAVKTGATAIDRAAIEKVVADAAREATLRPALSGTLAATAKRVALTAGMQGTYGMLSAAVNDSATVMADVVNNAAQKKQIPLPAATQILEDLGIGFGGGLVMGVGAEGLGAGLRLIRGGFLDRSVEAAAAQVDANTAEAQPTAGRVPAGTQGAKVPTRPTLEQNRAAYDARMAHLKDIRDSLQSKLATVKDPEQRSIAQARIADLNEQLKTQFSMDIQWFANDPTDETLGNLHADEIVNPPTPEKPAEAPAAPVTDEQMGMSYEAWVAAGEKIASPTDVPTSEFKPTDPATFNRDYLKSLNDPHAMAQLVVDLRTHGQASNISTDLERIAYAHRDDRNPVLSDSEMVRARSAVRRNIDAIKQYQASQGDENMIHQLEYESTQPDPTEVRLRKELTTLRAKVKEQENVLEQLRQRADIVRERNTPEEQTRTGKEYKQTATEAVKSALAEVDKQQEAVVAANRDVAIVEDKIAKVPGPEAAGPVNQSEFEKVLFHDPGWERAQAKIADLQDQLHTAAIEQRVAVGYQKQVADNKVAQLRDALSSARKEAGIVVKLVKGDFKLSQRVKEAQARARKIRDTMIANVNRIVKGADQFPDEYRVPLEGIAGRINKNMGADPNPISALRDMGEMLGDHGKHPFSVWDDTDVAYLTEISKKPADKLTVNDLTIIHDAVNDFKAMHDLEKAIRVGEEKVAKDKAAVTMNREVAKRTTKELRDRVKAVNGRPEFINTMWGLLKTLGKEEMHFSNLVAWLSGGEDSLTHRVIAGEVDKGNSAFRERVNRWGELHSEWFKNNGLNEFDFFRAKRKVQVTADGETRDLTAGYVISAYMHSLRDDNSASFKRGTSIVSDKHFNIVQMSDALIQKMFDEMTPQEKQYTDHLTSVISQVTQELDAAFYSRYQRHPKTLDNYWHIARITETMTRIQDRKFQGIDVGKPDIFTHRTGAVTPIYWRPAENDLFDLFNRAGRWIDMAEPIGHARSMLAEISLGLKEQQGDEKATTMVAKGLAAYAGKNSTPEEFEKVLMKMRSAGTKSVLGGPRVTTMTKNTALGIRSIPYVGLGDWSTAAYDVMRHPKTFHNLWIARSGLYEDIARAGGSKELQDLFIAESRHPKLTRALMAPEMAGFRAGSRIELESVHRNTLKAFQKGEVSDQVRRAVESHLGKPFTADDMKAWTPEERDVLATKAAEALLKRNHATITPGFQANLTREGPVGVLATTLQSEKLAGVNMVISAWMDAAKTKNGYKTAVKASMIHFLAEPAIMAGIRMGWLAAVGAGTYALLHKGKPTKIDYKQVATDEIFSDWFSNIVAGGDLFYITKQAIATARRGGGGGGLTLIGQYPSDFLNIAAGISALARAKNATTKFNAALSLGIDSMSLIGMMTGLPIKGTADTVIGVYEAVNKAAGGQ